MTRLRAAVLLLALGSATQAEEIYRWVDANGVVNFSSTPPPGQAVEARDLHFISTPDPEAAEAAREQHDRAVAERRERQQSAAQTAGEQQRIAAARRANCEAARDVLTRLQNAPPTLFLREDGSYQRYTQEQVEQELADARASERDNCN